MAALLIIAAVASKIIKAIVGKVRGKFKARVPEKKVASGGTPGKKVDGGTPGKKALDRGPGKKKAGDGKKARNYEEEIPKKVKTKGKSEEQLSSKGKYDPVGLTKAEELQVNRWANQRNAYLKKWRGRDFSGFSEESQRLLKSSAENAIKKNMTPDDLAAVLKENRGVEILKPDGTPYQHAGIEWPSARRSILNTIGRITKKGNPTGIRGQLSKLAASGMSTSAEYSMLQEKLGDLSRLLDASKKIIAK